MLSYHSFVAAAGESSSLKTEHISAFEAMKCGMRILLGVSAIITLAAPARSSSTNETLGERLETWSHARKAAAALTYVPGKAVVHENGLVLSQGLASRVIAESGQRVKLHNGDRSDDSFHDLPDAAAVFKDPKSSNYKYVSNSETKRDAGVGSITFNKDGKVIGYERLLEGTQMNCGGGKTFWNTWLSCEEFDDGQIWEVNPFTGSARQTVLGRGYSAPYESAAYDNRNNKSPTFYATIDRENGPLLKFTPSAAAIKKALDTGDYSQLLHTRNDNDDRAYEYLILNPDKMTFSWTSRVGRAEESAEQHYPKCEGLDIRKGMLYMTCKQRKQLFILDLDAKKYKETSTASGAFDGEPDQVARLLGSSSGDGLLYFCEDANEVSGVHGRDANGKYFTILQGKRGSNDGETSGLAFSPGNKFMYVSFQKEGKVFEIRRKDGQPFHGQRLDIKYHEDKNNDNPF